MSPAATSPRSSGQYTSDRVWSDRFIPEIKRIVGPYLLQVADLELDTKEATDLLVFKARDMRIAARIRDAGKYKQRYGNQFTIRLKRDNGATTELEKIQRGWGDWFFYGFGESDLTIRQWFLIDLTVFRYHLITHGWEGCDWEDKPNGDGTYFRAFAVRSFPSQPALLVASSFEVMTLF